MEKSAPPFSRFGYAIFTASRGAPTRTPRDVVNPNPRTLSRPSKIKTRS